MRPAIRNSSASGQCDLLPFSSSACQPVRDRNQASHQLLYNPLLNSRANSSFCFARRPSRVFFMVVAPSSFAFPTMRVASPTVLRFSFSARNVCQRPPLTNWLHMMCSSRACIRTSLLAAVGLIVVSCRRLPDGPVQWGERVSELNPEKLKTGCSFALLVCSNRFLCRPSDSV